MPRVHRPARARRGAFWILTGIFFLGMVGATLPSPLYPLYQSAYGLSNTTVTVVFALYGAGVLLSLFGLGRASDQVGRKPMLYVALSLAGVSTMSFLLARGLAMLLVGRFFSGLAIGVLSGTATAALAELEPSGNMRRASVVSAIVTPAGLSLGTLAGGAAIEYGPVPLRLTFAIYLGLLFILAPGVLFLPETVTSKARRRAFEIARPHVPRDMRTGFVIAATGVFAAFAMTSLFASLLPSLLVQALDEPSHLLSGGALALMFGAAAAAAPIIGRGSISLAGLFGLSTTMIGLALFVLGLAGATLVPIVLGATFSGFGSGCFFVGTLALVNRHSPPDHRAEVVSAYFVAGSIGVALPPVGLGLGSVRIGTLSSVLAVSAVIVALAIVTEVGIQRTAPRPSRSGG